ncbi:MAG: hypothetical protein V1701_07330 [Planctomycetota bacterium]
MIKNTLLALSIIANIALIVVLATAPDAGKNILGVKNTAKPNDEAALYNRELAGLKTANKDLSQQMAVLQAKLVFEKSARMAGTSESSAAAVSGQSIDGSSSAVSTTETAAKAADRAARMQELGHLLGKLNSLAPQPGGGRGNDFERMKLTGEMMKLMGELEIEDINRMIFSGNLSVLTDPDIRKLFVNVAIGVLEEMGKPLTPEQIARYESTLERLAGLESSITNDSQNATEKAIARLQNADAINAILNDMKGVFTSDQVAAVQGNDMRGGRNNGPGPAWGAFTSQMDMLKPNVRSMTVSEAKDRTKVVDQLINRFNLDATTKEAVKPLATQYVNEYSTLKKTLESTYGKTTMDYYLDRNRSVVTVADANSGRDSQQAYNQAKAAYIQSNPGYEVAKRAMDIEFLQIQNKYQKEVAKITTPATVTGISASTAPTIGRMGGGFPRNASVIQFPNVD